MDQLNEVKNQNLIDQLEEMSREELLTKATEVLAKIKAPKLRKLIPQLMAKV